MASPIELYIRQAAAQRGIDPDIAVRVAKSEGGLSDPTRRADYVKGGYREPSYGPFQLLIGGAGTGFPTGMGNDALASGVDPRDPNQWQKGVDFALDGARRNGWGAWYGARDQGITGKMGIGGQPASLPGKLGGDSMVARDHGPQIAAATNTPMPKPDAWGGMRGTTKPPQGLMALLKGAGDKMSDNSLLSALAQQQPVEHMQLQPMAPAQQTMPGLTEYLNQFLQSRMV